MHDTPLPDLFMYGRPGCHLCDDSQALVEAILEERRSVGRPVPAVVYRDITTEPLWERAFFETIPVLELGARRLDLALSAGKIRRLLADALDDPATPAAAAPTTVADSTVPADATDPATANA